MHSNATLDLNCWQTDGRTDENSNSYVAPPTKMSKGKLANLRYGIQGQYTKLYPL